MNSDWRQVSIKQVCERITSGGTPRSTEHAYYEGGTIPWLTTSEVNYNIVRETERHITPLGLENSAAKVVPQDTVIVAMYGRGTAGRVAMAGKPLTTNQACCNLIIDRTIANPRYVFYALWHDFARLDSLATGSVQQNLSARVISDFEIALPPLREQDAIASILGALDDKIELNRRMSETLEGIARELYRAWFVDFTAGPAASHESAGELPTGWFYGTLADVSELSSESWQAKSAPDTLDYLDLSNVKWGRVLGTVKYSWDEAPSRARRILRTGDTIMGTVRPGNGSYSLITHEGLTGSTGFAVLRPKVTNARAITYLAATNPTNVERLAHLADGAAYPAVRPPVVHESPMTVPDQETLLVFSSAVDPLLNRIAVCEAENQTLEALRDTLLPKLISGELRVPEAEQLVSEVA